MTSRIWSPRKLDTPVWLELDSISGNDSRLARLEFWTMDTFIDTRPDMVHFAMEVLHLVKRAEASRKACIIRCSHTIDPNHDKELFRIIYSLAYDMERLEAILHSLELFRYAKSSIRLELKTKELKWLRDSIDAQMMELEKWSLEHELEL